MAIIFWFSAQPGDNLPDFDWADKIVKKTGHMLGYGILTFSYWYALGMNEKKTLARMAICRSLRNDRRISSVLYNRETCVYMGCVDLRQSGLVNCIVAHRYLYETKTTRQSGLIVFQITNS